MKRNIILLATTGLLLVACNNANLPNVDEATALERAAGILAHQKAEGFAAPNCFTINFHNNTQNEQRDPTHQITTTYNDLTQDFVFNADKLACYEHDVQVMTAEGGIVNDEKEVYRFYDKNNETYYVASNTNGLKKLEEKKMTEEEALTQLNQRRKARFAVLKFQQIIANFKTIVNNTNALIEKFKDSTEESAQITYASKDDKSLKVDYGYKEKATQIKSPYICDGFHTYNEVATYENDLLLNRSMTETLKYSNENYHYTSSLVMSNTIEINQTKGEIKLPNPSDYR